MPDARFLGRPKSNPTRSSPSMPDRAPNQGGCPPGMQVAQPYPGMPPGAQPCERVGPAVPAGGWKPARAGVGPGYPPTGERLIEALNSVPGALGGVERDQAAVSGAAGEYADWLSMMAGR